jgi:hypothetical protein
MVFHTFICRSIPTDRSFRIYFHARRAPVANQRDDPLRSSPSDSIFADGLERKFPGDPQTERLFSTYPFSARNEPMPPSARWSCARHARKVLVSVVTLLVASAVFGSGGTAVIGVLVVPGMPQSIPGRSCPSSVRGGVSGELFFDVWLRQTGWSSETCVDDDCAVKMRK